MRFGWPGKGGPRWILEGADDRRGLHRAGVHAGAQESEPARRILLQLEESAGSVRGQFAESSDAIAFRSLGDDGSRQVATFAVSGTLEDGRVRLSFAAERGRTFDIDGMVDKGTIKGAYVSRYSKELSQATGSGQFEIERF